MKQREQVMEGYTYEMSSPCGPIYVTCNDDKNGDLFEIFIVLGKAGGCALAVTNGIARSISKGLRSGTDPQEFIKTLMGTSCNKSNSKTPSCVSQIAQAIKSHEEGKKKNDE